MFIQESFKTVVHSDYEVAVCGGGFAGIAAALASARHGKKTVLFERQFMLGGLGTAGLVTVYLPLCDGVGHQVSFGIAEELFRLSMKLGCEDKFPDNWLDPHGSRTEKDKRFEVQYNPQVFAILAEKLLKDAGVDIFYGTYAVDAVTNGNRITHIVTENKSGRQAYAVKSVVDATGDCDIAAFSKVPTTTFQQGNVLASWYYYFGEEGYRLKMLGFCDVPTEDRGEDYVPHTLTDRRFGGLDGKEISEFMMMSHDSLLNDFKKMRKKDASLWPVTMATVPQIRMTRKIAGEYELSHKEDHVRFEDSIGMISNWKERGPVYEVPFRTLYSAKMVNLITAGRCTSVGEAMWDIMRVIPCCAVTGQAAGTAAALSDDFTLLPVRQLQEALEKDGVRLHMSDIF